MSRSGWAAAGMAYEYPGRPSGDHVVVPDAHLDYVQAAVSDNLNFASLRSMLQAADGGDLARGMQLFEEMLQKDATLCSVARTRTSALTGLDYEIVSAAEVEDMEERQLADETADYVRGRLRKIDSFGAALEHMATAIGSNLAVCENVWEGLEVAKIVPVSHNRLTMEQNEPGVVRVITSDDRTGIPAEGPKWIVHVPNSASGYPLTKSILRAQAFLYLVKMLGLADWVVFCEIFGMPIRIAKYQSGATPAERAELIAMMRNLGSKAFGVFSQAVQIDFVESTSRGSSPYKDMIEFCERAQAKIFLGGHLTADTTGGTGTLAAATVQNEVREDLRDDDIKREEETLRRQLFAPMCFYRFGKRDVPLPYFRRIKPEVIDRIQEADLMRKAQRTGIKIPADWARDLLGIPKPQKDEEVLEPLDLMEEGLADGPAGY